jgi:peptide deformylase
VLDIRLYGDPVLRARASEVEEVDDSLRQLAADMIETMRAAQGVGLAANQVGELRRIVVIDLEPVDGTEETVALVNPEIIEREGKMTSEEGCLSIPEVHEPLERDERVRVRFIDLDGEQREIEGSGLLAAVLQHEIDHLDGVLITDHISPTRRAMLRGTLKRIARQAARQT